MGAKRLPPIVIPDDPAILGYLAGLMDGEGTIGIRSQFDKKNSKNPSHGIAVSIINTDARLLIWLGEKIGGRVYGPKKDRLREAKGHKPAWDWCIYGENAERFLIAIKPHLIIKREQADLALAMRQLGRNRGGEALSPALVAQREAMKQRMHELNARGLSVAS